MPDWIGVNPALVHMDRAGSMTGAPIRARAGAWSDIDGGMISMPAQALPRDPAKRTLPSPSEKAQTPRKNRNNLLKMAPWSKRSETIRVAMLASGLHIG